MEESREPGCLHELVDLIRLVTPVVRIGPTDVQFVAESGVESVDIVDLVGIHTMDGTVANSQLRDQATFVDLAAGVAQVAEINVIVIGKIVVNARCVVVIVDAGGVGSRPIVKVVRIGRHVAVWLREMRKVSQGYRAGICNDVVREWLTQSSIRVVCGWVVNHVTAGRGCARRAITQGWVHGKTSQPLAKVSGTLGGGWDISGEWTQAAVAQPFERPEEKHFILPIKYLGEIDGTTNRKAILVLVIRAAAQTLMITKRIVRV